MSLLEKMPFLKARNFFCFYFATFYGGNCPVKMIYSHKTPQIGRFFLLWVDKCQQILYNASYNQN